MEKYNIFIRHTYKSLSKHLLKLVLNTIYRNTEQTIVAIFIFPINSKMAVSSNILFESEMYIFPRYMYVNIVPNPDSFPVFVFGLFRTDIFLSRIYLFWNAASTKQQHVKAAIRLYVGSSALHSVFF